MRPTLSEKKRRQETFHRKMLLVRPENLLWIAECVKQQEAITTNMF